MQNLRLATRLGFEQLPSRLPGEHAHERAKCVIAWRVDRRRRKLTIDSRRTSSSLASSAFSFGHDTPAHVQRRFAIRGVRCGDEWAALSAAPNAWRWWRARKMYSAHRSRDVTASAIESICLNQEAVGTRPSSVVSEALHIGRCGGCRAGTSEMFRTCASWRVLSTAIEPRPSRKCQIRAARRRCQRPQAVRNARSKRSGER